MNLLRFGGGCSMFCYLKATASAADPFSSMNGCVLDVTFGSWGYLGEPRGTFGSHGKRLCGPRVIFQRFVWFFLEGMGDKLERGYSESFKLGIVSRKI